MTILSGGATYISRRGEIAMFKPAIDAATQTSTDLCAICHDSECIGFCEMDESPAPTRDPSSSMTWVSLEARLHHLDVVVTGRHQWVGDLGLPYWEIDEIRTASGVIIEDAIADDSEDFFQAVSSAAWALLAVHAGCHTEAYHVELEEARGQDSPWAAEALFATCARVA